MSRHRRERGAALVVTLIFTTAMAAAAVAFLAGRHTDALALRGQLQAVEAQAMLDAALQETVAVVVNRKPRQRVPSQLSWQFADVRVQVRIEGESGKIDLNKADGAMLQGLVLALGLPEDKAKSIADAVVDWRDENQIKRDSGAEDRDYGGDGGGSSGAADRPFAHPAELRYVLNVDPATAALLAPHVTVYSGQEQPEPRKASAVVRRALQIARGLPKSKDDTDQSGSNGGLGDSNATDSENGNSLGDTQGKGDGSSGGLGGGAGGGLGAGTAGGSQNFGSDTGGFDSDSGGFGSATGGKLEAGKLSESGGETSGLSKLQDPTERRRARNGETDGGGAAGAADDITGAQSLFLDVRFPNGYEAAAKAVVAFGGAGGGQEPFVVLDWTPIVGERSGGT